MPAEVDLLTPLRQYWGYSEFRPLQERIVRSLLAGHDTCVVMPTGGGKSLCYQLPAVMSERTAVVISPLIALMQDQVAQLSQMGIPAALLNSSLAHDKQNRIVRDAQQGTFRLLYLSPERLQRADTLAWLRQVPISFFAIDEAHCISEWGHEFRPEYRQLSKLRGNFPDRPIAAFTASATRHVRHDILAQLALQNPHKYIASFHRPNLRYLVRECSTSEHSRFLLTALQNYPEGNVIVYSPTINKVEETVDFLENNGISAVPYHAKMNPEARQQNQERWMSDEVRVLVGTIAFGLGINKANVRAVIHLALPKSVEQFYQEAGRAGRDGKSSDCVLLWRKQDAGVLGYFANKILDPAERDRAWQRYHTIRAFAESKHCRHRQICMHFGETPKWESCDACDVCGSAPEWLTLAESRETVQQVFRRKPSLVSRGGPDEQPNPELREYLREWRRLTAKEQGVPAFVVLHDTTLEEICRVMPSSITGLRAITGIGERKAALFGAAILAALQKYKEGSRATALPQTRTAPAVETLRLLSEGKTLQEIAEIRGRRVETVINAVAALVETGETNFNPDWMDRNKQAVIEAACLRAGLDQIDRLKPLKDVLPQEVTYDEIRLVLAKLRRERSQKSKEIAQSSSE
ncbi:MAG TPA: RecQ family ATP-dependent DNA helicase [Candidatus Sulfotelmatobacter sp.]|nr:RecQ family ATP-dependent DNA helicase [Candidatus Sulfotelmatobacter sp.]